ncbi:RHS repeat domain-containing protein [Pseudomonas mandelii]|uniref:RHS repeat domain-containing protein n=1 Tax=Pseudomonas mandelii TaxID=75612 RepID=UPI00224A9AA7|nr:RHS repeat domain-containing protein [Pseudomonas mandelii]MCX2899612.1 YD repeat-containing protein [Pseudomonas mandelii]
MAGSDKKQQKLASRESASDAAAPLAVQDPVVAHFVMTGDPVGLIPRAKLNEDQKTTIATWDATIPGGVDEFFRLQVARGGSQEWTNLQEHTVTGGGGWVPLDFTIPSTFFLDTVNEGPFDLRYEHENAGGVSDHSNRVRIQIDKTPPNGALPPAKMAFTVTPPITDASFAGNDYLEATIPLWNGELLDVNVAFGWLKGELPEDPADIDLIGPQPIAPGGTVRIPKDKFINAGDGLCCGGYVLIDKAGNISALSMYELMSVALGALPLIPLAPPTAADATGGELLRSDIVDGGVLVNVPQVTNGKSTDTVVVKWKDQEITPGTPVGGNPSSGLNIFISWDRIWAAYGSATVGVVDHPLTYQVLRGVEPYDSEVGTVKVNLSAAGPVNPLPDPEPGNDQLKGVDIVGESGTANELIDTDEDKEINAKIELVAPLADGDSYQVVWNGTPIGAPYVIDVASDTVGETIEIGLDWDTIRSQGPNDKMPVWYELRKAFANDEEGAILALIRTMSRNGGNFPGSNYKYLIPDDAGKDYSATVLFDRRRTAGAALLSEMMSLLGHNDLPTVISVDNIVLGTQTFDGLGRMFESDTGGRKQVFTFKPGQSEPNTVTTPSGEVIEYDYQPQLGKEPILRRLPRVGVQGEFDDARYTYDGKNARLLFCEEQGLALSRTYYSTGELKSEKRVVVDGEYTMDYQYSRLGRLLGYTDVLRQTQGYEYDGQGRLTKTQLGTTASTFPSTIRIRVHSPFLERTKNIRTVKSHQTRAISSMTIA